MDLLRLDSLVLYKNRPARLLRMGERIEIEFEGGETARVRPKDVQLLHPGPIRDVSSLHAQPEGDILTAWEILAGGKTTLAELAELAYGSYQPATAWAAWQALTDQMYFSGIPDEIQVHSADEVENKRRERTRVESEQKAWKEFVDRTRRGVFEPVDRGFISEVEALALGRGSRSQLLRELGRAESPENAHAVLLDLKVWDSFVNPHAVRQGVVLEQVAMPVPFLPVEDRIDLTGLAAFAIDDEGTDTPDDAVSLDGSRIWVHVADVAALVEPGSPIDSEALTRVMSLHLPEGTIHLLPREVTYQLGLGLQAETPALSFGIDVDPNGQVTGFEIVPSRVRVKRMTYQEAETQMDEEPFRTLEWLTSAVRERRRANQAVIIDFPEVKISVEDRQVTLMPVRPYRSRALVEEAMILTGAETARFADAHGVCLPFSQQDPVETNSRPETLSGMFGLRRFLRRSRFFTSPGPHHGLGIPAYSQVTSPLRRFLDLVAHQQIRAFLRGQPGLNPTQVNERINLVEINLASIRQAEINSERHWTLVYLLQNPGWRGESVLVEKRGTSGTVLIPELALETRVHLKRDWPLDQVLIVSLIGINLAQGEVSFRVEE